MKAEKTVHVSQQEWIHIHHIKRNTLKKVNVSLPGLPPWLFFAATLDPSIHQVTNIFYQINNTQEGGRKW